MVTPITIYLNIPKLILYNLDIFKLYFYYISSAKEVRLCYHVLRIKIISRRIFCVWYIKKTMSIQ